MPLKKILSKRFRLILSCVRMAILGVGISHTSAQLFEFNFNNQNLQPSFAESRLIIETGSPLLGTSSVTLDEGTDFSLRLSSVFVTSEASAAGIRFFASTMPGYVMNLSGVRFEEASLQGAAWNLEVNVPDLVMLLANGETSPTFASHDVPIIAADYQSVPSVEILLTAWGLSPFDIHFDNVTVFGSITPVPEPETITPLVGLGLLGWALWRARVRNPKAT